MTETTTPVDPASPFTLAVADGGIANEESRPAPCFTIEHDDGARRRLRYEPRQDGPGWWRYDEEWTGTSWECHDRECVRSVSLTVDGGSII